MLCCGARSQRFIREDKKLLVTKDITVRSMKLLVVPGIATSKVARIYE